MSTEATALRIVEAALGLDDPAARAALIDAECGGDTALRARVAALLAHENTMYRLLPTESFIRPLGIVENIPERIGPYKVISEIARGGMGAVVKAERDDGVFAQTVAIKLIRADLASPRAKARFADERRILARLSHPGIVRILDGGEQDDRAWLAMDFVDGAPVTEALRRMNAGLAQRLDAFEAVCEAVAFAHRALVIHADIKPSNVLMTDDGRVHLLDFGIARLMVGLDSDECGDPYPLTKGYAAPERGAGIAPTIASDVFSLGALLLGMLGKATPGDDSVFVAGTRLPVGQLDGDLAAITGKALTDRPEDRYADVTELLADLRRHRAFEPVKAREPVGWRYHAERFVLRHRRGLVLTSLAALALSATAVISTVSYIRAETAREEADARFADARGAARYLLFDVMPKLENTPRSFALRAEMAAVGQRYLDRLASARQATDAVRLEAASGLWRLAQHQARAGGPNLNQPDRADANLRKAEAIATTLGGDQAKLLLARIRVDRVWLAIAMQADVAGAAKLESAMRESVAAAKHLDPSIDLDAQFVLADLNGWRGRFADEYAIADTALARLGAGDTADMTLARARLIGSKAEALYFQGRVEAALPLYREGLAMAEQAYDRQPGNNYLLLRRGVWRWQVGSTLLELNRLREALAMLDAGLIDVERGLRFDPADAEARRNVRVVATSKAQTLALLGRTDEAMSVLQRVLRDDEAALARDPLNPRLNRDVAYDIATIGETFDAAGRTSEACVQDQLALARYADLQRRGILTTLDVTGNRKKVELRIGRNCRR